MVVRNARGKSWRSRGGPVAFARIGCVALLSGLLAVPAIGQDAGARSVEFSLAARSADEAPAAFRTLGSAGASRVTGRMIVLPAKGSGLDIFPIGAETRLAARGEAVKSQRPPVKKSKVAAQVLAGAAVTGAAFGAAILTASEYLLDDDEAMLRRATTWYVVGGAALTPLAVYLIGNSGPQTGSLGKTYLFGLAGVAAGTILLLLAFESDYALGIFAFTVSTLGPAVGAVIGYNSSRRYDPPGPVQTALLNMGQGKFRLGVPAPQIFFSGLGRRSPGLAVRIFQAEL